NSWSVVEEVFHFLSVPGESIPARTLAVPSPTSNQKRTRRLANWPGIAFVKVMSRGSGSHVSGSASHAWAGHVRLGGFPKSVTPQPPHSPQRVEVAALAA